MKEGCTFFFCDEYLGKTRSEKELTERLTNTKKDFKHHRNLFKENFHEHRIEFIKQITLAFLPDKIVCCLKKDGKILATNVIKEVYDAITEDIEINRSKHQSIDISEDFMEKPITVSENNTPQKGYTRSLKEWCWRGFEHIKTFMHFTVNENIRVELMLPYEDDLFSDSIRDVFEESQLFESSFFFDLSRKKPENIEKDLRYAEPCQEVIEEKEVNLGILHPYEENMMRRIEEEIRGKDRDKDQVWIYNHFVNNSYSRECGRKELDFIFKDFGFYVSFTTLKKEEVYWENLKKYAKDKRTIFSKIKEKLMPYLEIENGSLEGENLKAFKDALYAQIRDEKNFKDFEFCKEKYDEREIKKEEDGNIQDDKVHESEDIFMSELKKVFDVYWYHRTKQFYQSSEVGVASFPRFTRLPEFLIELSPDLKDPRNNSYDEHKVNSNNEEERNHYKILVETEKFLFSDVISEYTVFPIIMNNVYWGVILVFWFKSEEESEVERYRNIYDSHRKIFEQLRMNLLSYAERGIISEFENYTRDKILKVRSKDEFEKESKNIERESRRNPLIPDINIFRFERHCNCPVTFQDHIMLDSEEDRKEFERLSNCLRLCEENIDYKKWKFAILSPSRKKQRFRNEKKICTIFSGKRPRDFYPLTIRLNCMAIDDYINTAWEVVLSEMEKKKLYIRDAAVAIMLDTFSHNIAAHSMRHLLNLLNEQGQKQLDVWKRLSLDFAFEKEEIGEILDVKEDKEWAEQPVGIQRYIGFLREKSTFWNGLISEIYTSWGSTINLYEVIKKFIENYLYIGSIASDLGVDGVEFHIGIDDNEPKKWGTSTLYEYSHPEKSTLQFNESDLEWKPMASEKDKLELGKRELYFPGGLIGLHALYTILENTIRNAKFVQVEEKIIPLNIMIREEGNFFEIRVGIDHKSKDINKINNIEELLKKPIIDENNKAQKGGVLQSKISAAMLRGYNLIRSNESLTSFSPPLINIDSEFLQKEEKVFWRFYVWKASSYRIFDDGFLEDINEGRENPLRFKFLIVPPDKGGTFGRTETDKFPIRVVHLDHRKKDYSEQELYLQWLKEWTEGEAMTLLYKATIKSSGECVVVWDGEDIRQSGPELSNPSLAFSFFHSGEHAEGYSLCVDNHLIGTRSHGIFGKLFLEEHSNSFNQKNIPALIESVYTSITIVDNEMFRLWSKISQRFGGPPEEIQSYVAQTLRLKIFKEVNSKDKLWEMVTENPRKHIFIVHLSMLEDLYGKEKEDRHQFMQEAFRHFHYVILTTGRGRENAYAELDREYKIKTRFIYRNQFEKAFDTALEVVGEEIFMVKYFLVKILLGG